MSEKTEPGSDSTGEWRARTGVHHEIDTAKLRALDGSSGGSDPYNHSATATPSGRRSLDDMRRLSETIKKSRHHLKQ
jgi:hypothetical protein